MGLPQRKTSKSRKNKRRANWKLKAPSLTRCSRCHQFKSPHSVCPNCGYYGGREVIKTDEEL